LRGRFYLTEEICTAPTTTTPTPTTTTTTTTPLETNINLEKTLIVACTALL